MSSFMYFPFCAIYCTLSGGSGPWDRAPAARSARGFRGKAAEVHCTRPGRWPPANRRAAPAKGRKGSGQRLRRGGRWSVGRPGGSRRSRALSDIGSRKRVSGGRAFFGKRTSYPLRGAAGWSGRFFSLYHGFGKMTTPRPDRLRTGRLWKGQMLVSTLWWASAEAKAASMTWRTRRTSGSLIRGSASPRMALQKLR